MISYWMERNEVRAVLDWLIIIIRFINTSLPYSEPISKYTSNPVVIHSLKYGNNSDNPLSSVNSINSIVAPVVKNL